MSIHVCKCTHNGREEYHLRYPGMTEAAAQKLADRINSGGIAVDVLWLWKNFVDGKQEYWAFDNPFPLHMDCGDPQTLGEPCGYAIFKESRASRPDVDHPKRGGLAEAVKLARGGDAPIPFKRW